MREMMVQLSASDLTRVHKNNGAGWDRADLRARPKYHHMWEHE
jgi:hypothetical protein